MATLILGAMTVGGMVDPLAEQRQVVEPAAVGAADPFRLGSGAVAAKPQPFADPTKSEQPVMNSYLGKDLLPTPGKNFKPIPIFQRVLVVNPFILGAVLIPILASMMPQMAGGSDRIATTSTTEFRHHGHLRVTTSTPSERS